MTRYQDKGINSLCGSVEVTRHKFGGDARSGRGVAVATCGVTLLFLAISGPGSAWAQEFPPVESKSAPPAEAVPPTPPEDSVTDTSKPEGRDEALEPEGPPDEGLATTEETKPEPPEGVVDTVHGFLSHEVLATAEWLDSFFDDPRFSAEENRTTLKLAAQYTIERDSDSVFHAPSSIRLRLPKLEEKARLVVSGAKEQDLEGRVPESGTAASKLPGAQEGGSSIGLDYFFRATKAVNIAVRVGAKYRDKDLEMFVEPRYRKLWQFNPFAFRLTQDFKWWTEFGWESTTTLDLERPLSKDLFFRTTLQGAWTEVDRDTYHYSLGFNLRQILSPRRVIQYELLNGFQTRTVNDLDEVRLTLRYRQRVWRDWFFYEVAPYASYRADRDFDFTPGIMFRVEMFFGRWEGVGMGL